MEDCLICNSPIEPFIDFGNMPLGNGFLLNEDFRDEYRFPMQVGFCPACGMVQLFDQPGRERMFHENYAFSSSTYRNMENEEVFRAAGGKWIMYVPQVAVLE